MLTVYVLTPCVEGSICCRKSMRREDRKALGDAVFDLEDWCLPEWLSHESKPGPHMFRPH